MDEDQHRRSRTCAGLRLVGIGLGGLGCDRGRLINDLLREDRTCVLSESVASGACFKATSLRGSARTPVSVMQRNETQEHTAARRDEPVSNLRPSVRRTWGRRADRGGGPFRQRIFASTAIELPLAASADGANHAV